MTFTNREAIVELARQIREAQEGVDFRVQQAADAGRKGDSAAERSYLAEAKKITDHIKVLAGKMQRFTD